MIPADTSPDAQRCQDELFRRMGPSGRLEMALQMSEDMFAISQDGIRMRHPDYSDREVLMAAVRLRLNNDALFRAAYPGSAIVAP